MSALDFCTVTADVYRNATGTGGMVLVGTATVMPQMPVGEQLLEQLALQALRKPWQTFGTGDVQDGDQLEIGGVRYLVRWVGPWPWPEDGTEFVQVIAEESLHT